MKGSVKNQTPRAAFKVPTTSVNLKPHSIIFSLPDDTLQHGCQLSFLIHHIIRTECHHKRMFHIKFFECLRGGDVTSFFFFKSIYIFILFFFFFQIIDPNIEAIEHRSIKLKKTIA